MFFSFYKYFFVTGLCIPSNNTIFIKSVSEKLAHNEPHLTLEFLEECIQVNFVYLFNDTYAIFISILLQKCIYCQGFRGSTIELKHLCLEYMTPWLANLVR